MWVRTEAGKLVNLDNCEAVTIQVDSGVVEVGQGRKVVALGCSPDGVYTLISGLSQEAAQEYIEGLYEVLRWPVTYAPGTVREVSS